MGRLERRRRRRTGLPTSGVTRVRKAGASPLILPAGLSGSAPSIGKSWDLIRSWTPPAEWEAALREFSPPTERYSWLKLVWLAGEPWEPIQRWALYEMFPRRFIPEQILEWLEGPNPRTQGYLCPKRGRWISQAGLISRVQWELYQETRCHGRLFWIIQGGGGGHQYRLTETESALLEMRTGAKQMPDPGALPYAPFDARVIAKVRHYDRMEAYRHCVNFADRPSEQLDAEDRETLAAMRTELSDWLTTQLTQAVESIGPIAPSDLPTEEAVRPGRRRQFEDEDEVDRAFLTER